MTYTTMTCASVDDLLLEILEGDVSAETGAAVDAHVSQCARCTALLRDIGHVRERAAALPDLTPSSDLWKGIAARIETPVVSLGEKSQRRSFSSPGWMAAAASLLVVASSGVTYYATKRSIEPVAPLSVASTPAVIDTVEVDPVDVEPVEARRVAARPSEVESSMMPRRTVPATVKAGRTTSGSPARQVSNVRPPTFAPDKVFGSEIARLQRVVAERRSELDPQTVSVVETNLKLIDAAIKSSRAALARDPASGFLNQQLSRALDKKVELLRTVALMPSSS